MFGCAPDVLVGIAEELNKETHHQVGLSIICTDTASKIWYCISETESNRLKELPPSCETISITGISETVYTGILNGDSIIYSNNPCRQ